MFKLGFIKRSTAIVANLSLLLNSFLPFLLAVTPVYAQSPEGNVPEIVEVVNPQPVNAEPVEAPTPAPEVINGEPAEPTPTPEIIITPEATPTPELINNELVEITPTPVNSEIGSLNPVVENTPTPNSEPVESTPAVENIESTESTPTPEPENTESINTEPVEVINAEPVEAAIDVPVMGVVAPPVFKKVCLTDEQIRDATNEEWTINDVTQTSETNGNVQLGVRYVYPQDNKVSVIFNCLPKEESQRTSLKIQKIKTSELSIPDTSEMGEYAYDITTGMANGDFSYDLTLPKPENSTAQISYIEKTLDQAIENVEFFDLKKIEESKTKQQNDSVKATSVDHFTIFFVSNVIDAVGLWSDTLSTSEKEMVKYSDNIRYKNNGLWPIALQWKTEFIQFDSGNTFPSNITVNSAKIIFEYQRDTKYWLAPEYAKIRVWDGANWQLLPDNLWISDSGIEKTFELEIPLTYVNTADKLNNFKYQFKLAGAPKTYIDIAVLDVDYSYCGDGTIDESLDEQCDDGDTINGDGCSATCQIETSTITVSKDVKNPNGDDVSDTQSFFVQLNGVNQQSIGEGSTYTYIVNTGTTHTVSETSNPNYDSKGCKLSTGGDATNFTVTAGQNTNVICTNWQKQAIISVSKDVLKSDGSSVEDNHSFEVTVNGELKTFSEGTSATFTVNPGTYSIVESVDPNYTAVNNNLSIAVFSNGLAAVTIENKQNTGSLKIIKDSQPDNTQNFIFTLTDSNNQTRTIELDDDSSAGNSSRPNNHTFTNLIPGEYKVVEDYVTGWTLDNISCTDTTGDWKFEDGYLVVYINPGEKPVCTFTNGLDTGILTAHKFEDNNNNQIQDGGENNLSGWDMNLYRGSNCNGSYLGDLDTNSSGDANFSSLVPGNYSVREALKSGWENTTSLCQNVTINHNDNKIVNFGNYKLGKIEGRKYYDKNGDKNRDTGEDYLSNWRIFIDKNGNGVYNSGEYYDYTDNNGYYKFDNLSIGNYTICEQMKTDWYNSTSVCQSIHISANDTDTINFGNMKYGSIMVCKIIVDGDNNIVNGSETPDSNFTINWDNGLSSTIINAGNNLNTRLLRSTPRNKKDAYCITIDNLKIKNYHYNQEIINDSSIWQTPKYNDQYDENIHNLGDFYKYNSDVNSNGDINLSLDAGINRTLVILNQYKFGEVNVFKFNDLNDNGKRDCIDFNSSDETKRVAECQMEPLLPDWTINLSGETKVTGANGSVTFDKLSPNTYTLSETMQDGWTQTKIYCEGGTNNEPTSNPTPTTIPNLTPTNTPPTTPTPTITPNLTPAAFKLIKSVNAAVLNGDSYNHKLVTVNAGDNLTCYIGNQRLNPQLSIAKSNNVVGNLSPGDAVEYTINLGIAQNDVTNLKVTDLLSNGFKYRLGSYKVYLNGAEVVIPEPRYASPGVWDLSSLGTLTPEDELRLVYTADISTDQQPGKYTDLAWAISNYAYDSSQSVLATANPEGYVDTNFVGTIVPIVKNTQNSVSAEVEQKVEGQVLGVSTEFPATGAATLWLLISGLIGTIGFALLKINKKTMLTLLFALLSFGLIAKPVFASDFVLSIQEPKTPTNTKDLKLEFKALHLNKGVITAKCLKKGPNDSGFSQFGSNIVLSAGGNSSSCDLSLAINDNGSYQFMIEATDGVATENKTVSLDYNTSTPGTVRDYRKEWLNNGCDYKIHFKTDDDNGKTVKVELYRSTDSAFSANNESLVHSVNIGSNQEYDITNSVPDCSKTYYYALRAFDNAGNGSGLVGDRITITTSTTTTSTTVVDTTTVGTGTGAIPVIDSDIPAEGSNQITPSEGEVLDTNNSEETGQVLGTIQGNVSNFVTEHKIISSLIAIGLLSIIIYVIKKIRKNKKR